MARRGASAARQRRQARRCAARGRGAPHAARTAAAARARASPQLLRMCTRARPLALQQRPPVSPSMIPESVPATDPTPSTHSQPLLLLSCPLAPARRPPPGVRGLSSGRLGPSSGASIVTSASAAPASSDARGAAPAPGRPASLLLPLLLAPLLPSPPQLLPTTSAAPAPPPAPSCASAPAPPAACAAMKSAPAQAALPPHLPRWSLPANPPSQSPPAAAASWPSSPSSSASSSSCPSPHSGACGGAPPPAQAPLPPPPPPPHRAQRHRSRSAARMYSDRMIASSAQAMTSSTCFGSRRARMAAPTGELSICGGGGRVAGGGRGVSSWRLCVLRVGGAWGGVGRGRGGAGWPGPRARSLRSRAWARRHRLAGARTRAPAAARAPSCAWPPVRARAHARAAPSPRQTRWV